MTDHPSLSSDVRQRALAHVYAAEARRFLTLAALAGVDIAPIIDSPSEDSSC